MDSDVRKRTWVTVAQAVVVALVMLGLPMVAAQRSSAGAVDLGGDQTDGVAQGNTGGKVTVCHIRDDGTYQARSVSVNALPAHLRHGDSLPDDPVPAMVGYWFDDACVAFDSPPVVEDQTFVVDENAPDGTVVGAIVVSDPETPLGDVVTVTVTGGTGQTAFAVDPDGLITVADSSQLDYETTPTFTLAVTVADLAGMTDTATITIDLNDLAPTVVTVVGPYPVGSVEADALEAEFAAYSPDEVEVTYEEYFGLADLADRVTGLNPPDLIISPQPGALEALAPHLVDLGEIVDPVALRSDFGDYLIDSVTDGDTVLGAPIKAYLSSLVWYKPATFEASGYQVPETFDELVALSDRMVADGMVPWCNYIESGFITGWVGTHWVGDLVLGAEGPAVYDDWVDHDVLFADPRIEAAFERYLYMIDTPGYVFDRANMLNEFFWYNAVPLGYEDCLMHKQAPLFGAAIQDFGFDLDEFSTFEFPAVNPAFDDAATGAANYLAAVNDSTEVRQLTRFMVSDQFGTAALAESGTAWILPNVRFDTTTYSDDFTRSFAETVQVALLADQFRFVPSDLMPPEVRQAFWTGIVDLVAGAKTIPQILNDIDASWPT